MAALDLKKFTPLDWGVAGGGALALICLFLPWYGFSSGPYSASVSGWSTSYGWLGAVLIVLAGGYLVAQRSGMSLKLPIGSATAILAAAGLGTIIVALRWLTLPSGSGGSVIGSYSYGPSIGIILTIIAGLVATVAAFLMFRASGEQVPWAKQGATGGSEPPSA